MQRTTKLIPGNLEYISMHDRPEQWKLRVELLREAGCKCDRPYVEWRAGVGPRCHACNTVAEIAK